MDLGAEISSIANTTSEMPGGKPGDPPPKSPPAPEGEEAPSGPPCPKEEDGRQQKISSKETPSPPTLSISKTAKCRFTEVARCMLEIIEDLQMKKLQPEAAKEQPAASAAATAASSSSSCDAPPEDGPSDGGARDSKSLLYTSAAEYHVYEEIVYDLAKEPPVFAKAPDMPPPLPARPTAMFPRCEQRTSSVPAPPPRKSRCPLRKGGVGPQEEVRNRPKQRGNLYCLFADRAERRSISRSLEREFRVSDSNQDDDYGFRKEFVSI